MKGLKNKTASQRFLWNSSMQSLETQLLKPLALALSEWLLTPTPPFTHAHIQPAFLFPLPGHGRWKPAQKERMYRGKKWCLLCRWDSSLGASELQSQREHVLRSWLTVWDDWTVHSAALDSEEEEGRGQGGGRPGPLGASVGPAAWCRLSLDCCCWSWLGVLWLH